MPLQLPRWRLRLAVTTRMTRLPGRLHIATPCSWSGICRARPSRAGTALLPTGPPAAAAAAAGVAAAACATMPGPASAPPQWAARLPRTGATSPPPVRWGGIVDRGEAGACSKPWVLSLLSPRCASQACAASLHVDSCPAQHAGAFQARQAPVGHTADAEQPLRRHSRASQPAARHTAACALACPAGAARLTMHCSKASLACRMKGMGMSGAPLQVSGSKRTSGRGTGTAYGSPLTAPKPKLAPCCSGANRAANALYRVKHAVQPPDGAVGAWVGDECVATRLANGHLHRAQGVPLPGSSQQAQGVWAADGVHACRALCAILLWAGTLCTGRMAAWQPPAPCSALRWGPTGASISRGRERAVVRTGRLPYSKNRHTQKEWLQGRTASASSRSALPRCSPSKPWARRVCVPAGSGCKPAGDVNT